jgi:hypothetical protein
MGDLMRGLMPAGTTGGTFRMACGRAVFLAVAAGGAVSSGGFSTGTGAFSTAIAGFSAPGGGAIFSSLKDS